MMIFCAFWVYDDFDIEYIKKRQVSAHLFGNQMSITVGVAND
jgi:hypothetical protein